MDASSCTGIDAGEVHKCALTLRLQGDIYPHWMITVHSLTVYGLDNSDVTVIDHYYTLDCLKDTNPI